MMKQKIEKTADEKMWNRISQIPAVVLVLLSGIDIVRFAILGDRTAFITFSMIAVAFMLVAYMAWKSKMPFLYLVIAAAAFVLYFNTNFSTSTYYFNWLFLVESIIAALGGILGIAVMIGKKIPVGRVAVLPLLAAVLILAGFLGFWKVRYEAGHEAQGQARDELWAVPAKYDAEESEQAGTVEEVVYDTKEYRLICPSSLQNNDPSGLLDSRFYTGDFHDQEPCSLNEHSANSYTRTFFLHQCFLEFLNRYKYNRFRLGTYNNPVLLFRTYRMVSAS